MPLTAQDRRDIIALCCHVARADGDISPREYEHLIEQLSRLGEGQVGFDELQRWLEETPPACTTKISEEHLKLFLREAVAVAHADGKVDDSEVATIKRLVHLCFEVEP